MPLNPIYQATKIALELKKQLVDQDKLDVSQVRHVAARDVHVWGYDCSKKVLAFMGFSA